MSFGNSLTSLSRVRGWAGVTTTNDDGLLTSIIGEVSQFILSYLGRPSLFLTNYTDLLDGAGQRSVMLRNWPVTRITQLTIGDCSIPAAANTSSPGYVLEPWSGMPAGAPQRLSLRGYNFSHGIGTISVSYDAGYIIAGEPQIIPASGITNITVNAAYGSFAQDNGVTYANGTPLAPINGTPVHGQYSVSAGIYTFAAADAGMQVLISYSYIPADIEHACVALAAERYRSKNHIGEASKSLGGQETVSFIQKDMPEFIRTLLQPYRRVVPC